MLDDKIIEFYREFLDEVKETANRDITLSTQAALKEEYISCLIDAGVTNLADCEIIEYKKETDKIKLDGYAYSDYFHSLTLLVSEFSLKDTPQRMGKADIEKLVRKTVRFYKLCKGIYFEDSEETADGYKAYTFIKEHWDSIETVNIILITNNEAVLYVPDEMTVGRISIKFDVWDIERLYQCVVQNTSVEQISIKLKKKYDTSLPMVKVEGNNPTYDCYVGIISGELLAKIYKDEGQRLIERNVRSFLQATGKINKGIKITLETAPDMFMAYNNGISTIAEEIEYESTSPTSNIVYISRIDGWQIVNGGQTTNSIANAYSSKVDLSKVNVQIKLSVIKDKEKTSEIIGNISKYANSQNKINMSDFSANDDYHVRMERLSRTIYIPTERGGKSLDRWFYERARGQYLVEVNRQPTPATKKQFKEHNPKSRCISKTVAAKCVMAWRGYPHSVSKGLETNFIEFSEMLKSGKFPEPNEKSYIDMISNVILFNTCDKLIATQKFGGFKAQQVYYTVALIGRYYKSAISADYIWKNQDVSPEVYTLIRKVMYDVWDHFQAPAVPGVNIGQWCKKEECWEKLLERYEKKLQEQHEVAG